MGDTHAIGTRKGGASSGRASSARAVRRRPLYAYSNGESRHFFRYYL
jgi:hypothetical protein